MPPSVRPRSGSFDGPRERLLSVGVRHLACRELLALVVGSGSRAGTVSEIAERLLRFADGSLRRLGSADPRSLESLAGVGPGEAVPAAQRLIEHPQADVRAGSVLVLLEAGDLDGLIRAAVDVSPSPMSQASRAIDSTACFG